MLRSSWDNHRVAEILNKLRADLAAGKPPQMADPHGYPYAVVDHIEAFTKFPIRGKRVLVAGSETPWVEIVLNACGASEVLTSEYRVADFRKQSNITTFVSVPNVISGLVSGDPSYAGAFDAVVSFSSIEHDGLGRYCDPVDPNGDAEAVREFFAMLKLGGHLYLGIPAPVSGHNATFLMGNGCRMYNRRRFKHITQDFSWVDTIRTHYEPFGGPASVPSHEVMGQTFTRIRDWMVQPIFILRKEKGNIAGTTHSREAPSQSRGPVVAKSSVAPSLPRRRPVMQDIRTVGLQAAGFANFLVHWHAGFKAARQAGIPYALDPQRVGYIGNSRGLCPKGGCSDYVDLFRFGLLDRSHDIIGPDIPAARRVDLPDHLPSSASSWSQALQDTIASTPNVDAVGFTCDRCQDGDFASTAPELRRRIIGDSSNLTHRAWHRVSIAVHVRRGDLVVYPNERMRERIQPDRWFLQILNAMLEVCTLLMLTCDINLFSQGVHTKSGENLTSVEHLSHRYKSTEGGYVDEHGVLADWRQQLRCTNCLRTHLNGHLEHDLKQMMLADVLLGSCSSFSHFAAALSNGVVVMPANTYTAYGYDGVLSPNGYQDRALIVSPTDGGTFNQQRFQQLLLAYIQRKKAAQVPGVAPPPALG